MSVFETPAFFAVDTKHPLAQYIETWLGDRKLTNVYRVVVNPADRTGAVTCLLTDDESIHFAESQQHATISCGERIFGLAEGRRILRDLRLQRYPLDFDIPAATYAGIVTFSLVPWAPPSHRNLIPPSLLKY